jgi:hypothetical protein
MRVWILTSEYNDYDQHGEYFLEVYSNTPTVKQLMQGTGYDAEFCQWLLNSGGGRENPWSKYPDVWYNLNLVDCK